MPFSFTVKRRLSRVIIFICAIAVVPVISLLVSIARAIRSGGSLNPFIICSILVCTVLLSILLHNILRLKLRIWKYCWRIFELLYSLAEFSSLLTLFTVAQLSAGSDLWSGFDQFTFLALLAIILLVVQALSAFSSLLDIRTLGIASLRQPYNLSRGQSDGNRDRPIEIFGAQVWKKRYNSEGCYMQWMRGIVAISCFVLATITGFYGLFYQPAESANGGRTPTKLYWADDYDLFYDSPPHAIMVFPNTSSFGSNDQPDISVSVNVTASPSNGIGPIISACERSPELWYYSWFPRNLTVMCQIPGNMNVWPEHRPDFNDYRRELLYSIDFSDTIDPSSLVSFYILNMASLPDLEAITRATQSAPIWPGARLLAFGTITQVGRLSDRRTAVLGLTKCTPLLTYNIHSILQDPFPPLLNNNQSASLRVVFNFVTSYVRVERESSENNVLTGFSFVGGVWTFLDGFFGVMFGCTLTLVLFGIKPLSVYGVVHFFSSPRPSLYTDETSPDTDDHETIRTLRQHLLDFGDNENTQRPSEAANEENVEKHITPGSTRAEQA